MSSLKDKRSSRTKVADGPFTASSPAQVVIGRLVGLTADGAPLVAYPGSRAAVPALATARYDKTAPGASVALMFLDGDPARPLAIGLIDARDVPASAAAAAITPGSGAPKDLTARDPALKDATPKDPAPSGLALGDLTTGDAALPEDTLTLTATRQIVLQCGRASIVLTRAGKILVRGAYVSLRSSGMQRITGASVQIN